METYELFIRAARTCSGLSKDNEALSKKFESIEAVLKEIKQSSDKATRDEQTDSSDNEEDFNADRARKKLRKIMAGEGKWTMAVRKGLLELFTSQELRTGSLTGINQLNSTKLKLIEDVLHEWCNVKKTEYITHKVFRTQVGNVIDSAKRPPADRRMKEEASIVLNIKN